MTADRRVRELEQQVATLRDENDLLREKCKWFQAAAIKAVERMPVKESR